MAENWLKQPYTINGLFNGSPYTYKVKTFGPVGNADQNDVRKTASTRQLAFLNLNPTWVIYIILTRQMFI